MKWPPNGPRISISSPALHRREKRRDLAVLEPLDRELHGALLGRRGDRIAALRLVAVRRGQAHVHVLPGREGRRRGGAKEKLLIRGVRSTTARSRRPATPAELRGRHAARSVARVPLLPPGIAVHVIAAQLPEARLVPLRELQAVDPLRRLPEVEMRDEQARGAAMLGRERLALVLRSASCLAADEIFRRHVGGVAVIGVCEDVGRRRLDAGIGEEVVDRERHARACRASSTS